MTSFADPNRPRRAPSRSVVPWVAGAAALAAIAVLLWVVLGAGRGEDGGEQRGLARARRVPTVNAVEAVSLGPVDPSPLAALGGPGSVVREDAPFAEQIPAAAPGQRRQRTRAQRRAARPRSGGQAPAAQAGYRVLGPGSSDAPAAPAQPASPAED